MHVSVYTGFSACDAANMLVNSGQGLYSVIMNILYIGSSNVLPDPLESLHINEYFPKIFPERLLITSCCDCVSTCDKKKRGVASVGWTTPTGGTQHLAGPLSGDRSFNRPPGASIHRR